MEYSALTPKAKKVIVIVALLQGIIFAAVLGFLVAWNFDRAWSITYILLGVILAIALAWIIVVPKIRFKRYKYLISPDRIEVIEGVFWVKRTVVPIDRIHQISVSRGPIDSAFGVAKVTVITAGSTATFRFLEEERANEIALHLNNKIREKLGGGSDVQ